jgi:TPR repeat protein/uncharacterized membrane protein YhaH (DUF805 family)
LETIKNYLFKAFSFRGYLNRTDYFLITYAIPFLIIGGFYLLQKYVIDIDKNLIETITSLFVMMMMYVFFVTSIKRAKNVSINTFIVIAMLLIIPPIAMIYLLLARPKNWNKGKELKILTLTEGFILFTLISIIGLGIYENKYKKIANLKADIAINEKTEDVKQTDTTIDKNKNIENKKETVIVASKKDTIDYYLDNDNYKKAYELALKQNKKDTAYALKTFLILAENKEPGKENLNLLANCAMETNNSICSELMGKIYFNLFNTIQLDGLSTLMEEYSTMAKNLNFNYPNNSKNLNSSSKKIFYDSAIVFLKKANNPRASAYLAMLYYDGYVSDFNNIYIVEPDYKLALKYATRAYNYTSPIYKAYGAKALGLIYHNGLGALQDLQKAKKYYKYIINNNAINDNSIYCYLGDVYLKQNKKFQAKMLLKQGFEKGESLCQDIWNKNKLGY